MTSKGTPQYLRERLFFEGSPPEGEGAGGREVWLLRYGLISIGIVTLEGESLYITLNDYDRDEVTDWVRENVLSWIDETQSVSSREAC